MPTANQTSHRLPSIGDQGPALSFVQHSVSRLVATVCAQLGMDPALVPALIEGQNFGRGTGFTYRLVPEAAPSAAAVRVEVALPLHSVELLPEHWAQLLEMQAVLVAHMAWSLGLDPVNGQLRLSPLAAGNSPERVAADIDIGTVLATSVLQLVIAEAPQALASTDTGSDR